MIFPRVTMSRGSGAPTTYLPRRVLVTVAVICGTFGICSWAFWALYVWDFHGGLGQDWMVFYTAARAYLDGNLPLIFDGARFTAALNQGFADWLSFPLNLHPWVYPPTFLLLFLPFGLLPALASFVIFLLVGFIAVLAAVWLCAGPGNSRWMHIFSLLLCPAVPFNVVTGQNAFLTSALLVGAFGLLNRRPTLGGLLLGILTFKPQLWIIVPVALLAGREWRALASAVTAAVLLALASLAMFGAEAWRESLELMTGPSDLYRAWLQAGRLNGQSVFACATLLGAPSSVANLAQGAAVGIAAGCVYWIFRQRTSRELQLSALLAATILAGPHVSASDGVLLAFAASLFLSAMGASDLRSCSMRATAAGAVWVSPLFNPPSLFPVGLTTPVLILLFLAFAISMIREEGTYSRRRAESEPPRRAWSRAFLWATHQFFRAATMTRAGNNGSVQTLIRRMRP
jgi:alpha-1,2-mannosyltransferase